MPHNARNFNTGAGSSHRGKSRAVSDAQGGEEGLLRDLHAAYLLHAALALLLLLQELLFAADVATVALRGDVLAVGADRLAGDDPAPHGRLYRHLEVLARDELLELLHERPPAVVGLVAVDDDRERLDRVARDQDLDLDQVGGLVAQAGAR